MRWKLAIEKYINEHGYKIGTLVAFSGEVNDLESGPDGFTENSKILNPNLKGRDIREAFKGEEYQILLVANKFQTGFDQPLLCGMYVDRYSAGQGWQGWQDSDGGKKLCRDWFARKGEAGEANAAGLWLWWHGEEWPD